MEHRDVVRRDEDSFSEASVCNSCAILLPMRVKVQHTCPSFSLRPAIDTLGRVIDGPCIPEVPNVVWRVLAWRALMIKLTVVIAVVPVRDRATCWIAMQKISCVLVDVSKASCL